MISSRYEVAIMIYRSNDTSDRYENKSVCELVWEGLPDLGDDGEYVPSIAFIGTC